MVELRDAELEDDSELFIGPPPPALVIEVESSNEAERFEEVYLYLPPPFPTYDGVLIFHLFGHFAFGIFLVVL